MLSLGELPPLLKWARAMVDGGVHETVREISASTSAMTSCTGAAMSLSSAGAFTNLGSCCCRRATSSCIIPSNLASRADLASSTVCAPPQSFAAAYLASAVYLNCRISSRRAAIPSCPMPMSAEDSGQTRHQIVQG